MSYDVIKTDFCCFNPPPPPPVSIENSQIWSMWMTFNDLKTNSTKLAHYRLTLHNVCAVHLGVFSTLRDIIEFTGGVQYTGGYHEYTGRCSVQWGISWVQRGFQYTGGHHEYAGGYHDEYGGYHQYTGGCLVHTNSIFSQDLPPHLSWYLAGVLMISPSVLNTSQCTHDIPHCIHDIPHCIHDIPQCTAHPLPPVYCTSPPPGVLHRHYAGWDLKFEKLLSFLRQVLNATSLFFTLVI